jgi:predicted  nucleic acid-binding Zn-ribbon protein
MILTKRGLKKRIAELEGHEDRLKQRNREQRTEIEELQCRVWGLETRVEALLEEQIRLHERIADTRRREDAERTRLLKALDLAQQILELEKEEPA